MKFVMYNLSMIGVYHKAKGLCNHIELCKILERIKPDVIFEETPPSYFDKYYKDKTDSRLESDAILLYMENNNVEHILVDCEIMPQDIFFRDDKELHSWVEKRNYDYRNCIDRIAYLTEQCGFKFLNSDDYNKLNARVDLVIEDTIQNPMKEGWVHIRKKWNEHNDLRENTMLKNIYYYSKEHTYNIGVFLVGAAHRESMIKRIPKYQNEENVKVNWTLCYNGDACFG